MHPHPMLQPPDLTPKLLPIWEIPSMLKCPVIGTCLSVDDHRNVLRKAGYKVKGRLPHELHGAVMDALDADTKVARKVHALLFKRHGKEAEAHLETPVETLFAEFKEKMMTGELESLLYAMASRTLVPDAMVCELFGHLHMMAHTAKRDLLEERRKLKTLSEKETAMADAHRRLKRELLEASDRERRLAARTSELEAEVARLKTARTPVATSPSDTTTLREQIRSLREKNRHLVHLLEIRRPAAADDRPLVPDTKPVAANPVLVDGPPCFHGECEPESCDVDLCKKTVLVVGGMPRLHPRYRKNIEALGGDFEYDDGTMKGGKSALENRVRRSDVVICPINCNSHGACGAVKELCRKHGKQLRMLHSSSASAVRDALLNLEVSESLTLVANNRAGLRA